MQVREELYDLHTRRPPTQRDIYQTMYWFIDTIESPDYEDCVARNMYRSEINTLKMCVKLIINTNCTEMHGQQNIKSYKMW